MDIVRFLGGFVKFIPGRLTSNLYFFNKLEVLLPFCLDLGHLEAESVGWLWLIISAVAVDRASRHLYDIKKQFYGEKYD